MKIVLASQEYPPDNIGGIGSQTYIKAHGLAKLGHEIYVICPSRNNTRQEYKDGDVNVIRIVMGGNFNTFVSDMIAYSVALSKEIDILNNKVKLDIVDFPEIWNQGSFYLLNRNELNYVPSIIQLHSSMIALSKYMDWPVKGSEIYEVGTALEGSSLKLADGIYSSSSHSALVCKKHYGLNKKIPVIHTGIDTSLFTPSDSRKIGTTVVFVGRLSGTKGIKVLVQAGCRLIKKYPNLKIKIIGKEHQEGVVAELKKIAKENSAENMLEFAGSVDRKDLPDILRNADIFALPSYYEGGPGFAYLEAMSCGLPVIGCNKGGMTDVIKNGKNGFIIPPKNIGALVKVLDKLLKNPKLRDKLGKSGREFVVNNFDTKDCLKNIEKYYQIIINSKKHD